ncbi:B-cell receptor CD22 isoform X2 [Sebastes fasciatus]|uniref:B-cell receptor CD22 isoform X2 n=1 Tax=Sebastes fasciatus TaxID=394691 RepID=UPI003D9EE8DC
MKMIAQTVLWLLFLALIKNLSCADKPIFFTLEDGPLTAPEGSCIEIKCRVTHPINDPSAYWFWIKNAIWIEKKWSGTVIHSTDSKKCPVSSDFANRVTYIGSPSLSWNIPQPSPKPLCSILICDLKKTDSGNYSFRFEGVPAWKTEPPMMLNVTDNPCPITFEKPPVVNESATITLKCSTSTSCRSNLQIQESTQMSSSQPSELQQIRGEPKSTTRKFTITWQDDGKEFSCQTENNEDKYLVRNITMKVEYSPKEVLAEISPGNVVEGQSVTFTCSAKGRLDPIFTWFKNNQEEVRRTEAVWEITSIEESQSGEYHCEARNERGTIKSKPVSINVTYAPEVEVIGSSASVVKQGDKMTLTCNVKRSNPQPHTYVWFKNGTAIGHEQTHQYVVERIEPEDRGSYACEATNTVDTGQSKPLEIQVEYGPRKTNISSSKEDKKVKVGYTLTFYCTTDANPTPSGYSWYRYNTNKQIDSSQWKSKTTPENELRLERVQRADEACYTCNATNSIGTGEDSEPVCIQVLYAPTEPTLTMATEVREDETTTIRCTVESFPPSTLTLRRTSESNSQSSEWHFTEPYNYSPPNTLVHTFNVTSTHKGSYTCDATNSEGSKTSTERKLVVIYRPKGVTVQAEPALVVNENQSLTLRCSAKSHPLVTSVTWMKMIDGKSEILRENQTYTVKSVGPSDSGLYSCTASNGFGTGNSQQAEVKVKYAPKHTKITRTAEQQQPDGTRSVTLSCSSQSYPPVTEYSWYRKMTERDEKVSEHQKHTVYSDQPGDYYCTAKNEINQSSSDPLPLFNRGLIKKLLIVLFFIILLILILIVLVFRHKRKKSSRQGTTNTLPCFGFLAWWNGARRRNLMNDRGVAEPFRSRDDLLPDQPRRPNAQRCQPRPDNTPASNINGVYCTVNLPTGQHNEERHEDYENVSAAKAASSPNPLNYDTDTSEDEVEINYSQVSFKANPGHQRAGRASSSSSDEGETQYSKVKI